MDNWTAFTQPGTRGKPGRLYGRLVFAVLVCAFVGSCVFVAFLDHPDTAEPFILFIWMALLAFGYGRKGAIIASILGLTSLIVGFSRTGAWNEWHAIVTTVAFIFAVLALGGFRDNYLAAQSALHSSEEKYRQFVEKSLAGIFVYRDDRILYANSRFKEIVGHRPEDVIGRTFWEFIHEEDRQKVRDQIAQREREGAVDLHYECRLIAKDGRVVWVEVVSSPAENEGRPAVLVSAYNITSRKKIEEQQRQLSKLAQRQEEQLVHSTRLAEMGEMAAGVAHELNQPLTGIKNFARNAIYMLEEGAGNLDEVKENLHLISSQVDRASKIISQMRELARRAERHVAPVDVNNTLRESVEFVMPQMKLSGVEVVFALDPNLPEVMGDRIRLEQVFLNLLTNARHAMEEVPERRLTITTRHEPSSTWPVIVEIQDTGKGFARDVAEKLFQPFFSTKKASHGTGLGLSISLSIIKDHQGNIEAVGIEGSGATFTIRLPLGQDHTEARSTDQA